jgi:hypothetical protein
MQLHCAQQSFDCNRPLALLSRPSLPAAIETRVARFFLLQYTKTGKIYQMIIKFTKLPQNIPNDHKIYTRYDGISWNDSSWNDTSWNDISWNLKKRHLVECQLVERHLVERPPRGTPILLNLANFSSAFVEIWSRLIYIWPQEEVLVMRVVLTLGDERPAFFAPG